MSDHKPSTRRDFLSTSAKVTAAAGLVMGGCAGQEKFNIVAGPAPATIKPDAPVRLAWIGTGSRGRALMHCLSPELNVEIKAVCDPNDHNRGEGLALAQKKFNQTPDAYRGEEDYKKVLDRQDIDAVFIALPCVMHAQFYLAAFAAGKHFYGEKPMCIAVKEADAIVAAQERNPDVICQIGFQRRADYFYHNGIKAIREGMMGDLFGGYGAWNNCWGPLGFPSQGTMVWFGRKAMSGDWMLEQACHTWDVFNWVNDAMPIAASGMGQGNMFADIDPDRDVTDFYMANVEWPNNFMLDFEHSWVAPMSKFDTQGYYNGIFERVLGPKGGMNMSDATFYPRDPDGEKIQLGEPRNGDATPASVASFVNTVRTGGKPVSSVTNGRMATLCGLMVRKAVYERRRVTMDEILREG